MDEARLRERQAVGRERPDLSTSSAKSSDKISMTGRRAERLAELADEPKSPPLRQRSGTR
ncbi:MAG: hypothetical protein V3U13_02365 [Gemmatimonadota bacterium]|jgi:hypothetical protein